MYNIPVFSMEWNQTITYFVHTNFFLYEKKGKKKISQTFPRQASISWEGLVGILDNMEEYTVYFTTH